MRKYFRYTTFKRYLDLTLILLFMPLIATLVVIGYVLVLINLGRPVFFRQIRPGINGIPFTMYKFRSMLDLVDSEGHALPNEARLTRFGKFLRSTSLDEFPEIYNVIKGDMSLVGPRPLRMEYLKLYSPRHLARQSVKPGITGLAQVSGRNAISWEDRFELDVYYVENATMALDFKILLLTIKKVLTREDVGPCGENFMTPFDGDQNE